MNNTGQIGESLARAYLVENGYQIIEENYRNKIGEIDIIALDGNCLVFIEVKTRKSNRFGNPKYAVTRSKQRKISMVALSYLKSKHKMNHKARFDVVTIQYGAVAPKVEIIKNAFELSYG